MIGLSLRQRVACILFALITLASGIYCVEIATDSVCATPKSLVSSTSHSIFAVSSVDSNDAVIRSGRNGFDIEINSINKPKHIQVRIVFGIREYIVTAFSVIVLFSLLKGKNTDFFDAVLCAYHSIILFIHNKDGSKSLFA